MTDNITSTLSQIKVAEVGAMTKDQKIAFLKSRGWRMQRGNRWEARNGFVASFGNAVRVGPPIVHRPLDQGSA